jgi:hypothetical protein
MIMQAHRVGRLASITAIVLGIGVITVWTFANWLKPSTLFALLAGFSFCG